MPRVYVPVALRRFTNNQSVLEMDSVATLADLFKEINSQYPGIESQLYSGNGQINPYIAIFVNSVDIRDLKEADTPVIEKDEVHIIQAIAGG